MTGFFHGALSERASDPCAALDRKSIAQIDPALRRIDPTNER